ncbi:MAG: hypothetical protein H6936_08975 [Burkholderiales bacterium]|nr:hypothetical protein [Nitrosomonas sp.]MCP5274966.1 hypothetical protein [Burkholderiales bacterium]
MQSEQFKCDPVDFVAQQGGSYAFKLGIDLDDLKPTEIYKWFFAALLYGARISEKIATYTWQVFNKHTVMSPEKIISTGWDGLVVLLDEGGYVRYDFKTATKLLSVNQTLLNDYAGNLNLLHAAAEDAHDLERRLRMLGKGIGIVTAHIFLREMRGLWPKAMPPLSPLAFQAAKALGYLPKNIVSEAQALSLLQQLWLEYKQKAEQFSHFESALVRYGLHLRHQRKRTFHKPRFSIR